MEEFGNYWLENGKFLGNGSFGKVNEIIIYNKSRTAKRHYAIKRFSPDPRIPHDEIDTFRKRFDLEVECQSRCFHKNVVHVCIHCRTNKPWFVMELAECSLAQQLESDDCLEGERKLSTKQKIDIFKMVLDGINYIHNKGFIHRDIKALNILKFPDNVYKVSDFGLVKDINRDSTTLTVIGRPLGTDRYMSPEVQQGQPHSIQSDIFALGVLLEDLELTEQLEPIWRKCTERRPKDRYSNVQEIINHLNTLVEEQ